MSLEEKWCILHWRQDGRLIVVPLLEDRELNEKMGATRREKKKRRRKRQRIDGENNGSGCASRGNHGNTHDIARGAFHAAGKRAAARGGGQRDNRDGNCGHFPGARGHGAGDGY